MPGIAAREVAVGALGTVHALSADLSGSGSVADALTPLIARGWSLVTVYSLIAWFVFAPQCLSMLVVLRRETISWRNPLLTAAYRFALAYAGRRFRHLPRLPGAGQRVMAAETGLVVLIVGACLFYAVWTLMPAVAGQRTAVALLALCCRWPAGLATPLRSGAQVIGL